MLKNCVGKVQPWTHCISIKKKRRLWKEVCIKYYAAATAKESTAPPCWFTIVLKCSMVKRAPYFQSYPMWSEDYISATHICLIHTFSLVLTKKIYSDRVQYCFLKPMFFSHSKVSFNLCHINHLTISPLPTLMVTEERTRNSGVSMSMMDHL